MDKKKENIILIGLIVLVILALAWTIYSAFYGEDYKKAISAENKEDICTAPEGYTQEQWNEHMGHHPDQYKECLA